MKRWLARTSDCMYSLAIGAEVLNLLYSMCVKAGHFETGGVLIGRYSPDLTTALVLEATLPPSDSRRGTSWFNRGIAGLHEMLDRRWHSKNRSYYVGEWHFHPAAYVEPSEKDFAQMYRICSDPKYRCPEPVLLILGRQSIGQERSVRAFVFPRGERYAELFHLRS